MVTVTKENMAWMGIVLAVVVVVGGVLGSGMISQAQAEKFDIVSATIHKGSSGNALLTIEVKNSGNSVIKDIKGELFFDTASEQEGMQKYPIVFAPTTLKSGMTTTFTGEITNSEAMNFGESYNVSVTGKLPSESLLKDTSTVSVSRM